MHFLLASTALLALLKPDPTSAATIPSVKSVTLDIVNKNLAPDGFLRSTVVANGQYPGPAITAIKGQTLQVLVNNKLTDPTMRRSTTVSFDGIFQTSENAYNEGTAFVTTCPIAPGASYTYEVDLADQAGTFWYHSELSVQYVDGLRGALIVYDPDDPHRSLYDVDDLTTLLQLGDWWQNSTLPLLAGYEATGIVPVSDSGTVNGIGRYQGGPAVPFAVTNVVYGKRYRLRIINQSARNVFTVSIDNHPLTIIEVDGVNTVPHTVDKIGMLAGQRYSVVINANQPVANYWINAPFVGGLPARNLHQNATLSRSILRYKGAPIAEPTTPWTLGPENGTALVEADLSPLVATVPPPPDVTMTLDLQVIAGQAIWNVNNISYLAPKVPTLNKVLAGATNASDFDPTENTFVLPAHKTIEIEFPPTDDDDAHPFHLHGANFWVIKSMSSPDVNTVNPLRRDVVGVGGTGTTIRFRTDNPGPWMFHCHIFWHKQAGLATVMLSSPADIRQAVHPSRAWQALCPAYNALPAELQ
ncbi:putative multicopper oxidase family protein [Lyophyllum shimeji]|uniref:Multicopper oxidase family protein n=1 Tax=Lyophyllum shimeji TaxID=47721 RepID=A0A9P3UMG8_LYOSH|nr:putative multicopper oxidase family protein [Lyophyllum shimeji]